MSNEPTQDPTAASNEPTAGGETDSEAAAAVLAELSGIAGDNANDGESGDAPPADPTSAIDPNTVPVLKQTQRAQRAARNRALEVEKAEKEAAAKQQALIDAGAQGSVTNMPEDMIPRDEDGNPLWYFNPAVGRAVQANYMLNQPEYRKRKGLVPCMPPLDQITPAEELPPVA